MVRVGLMLFMGFKSDLQLNKSVTNCVRPLNSIILTVTSSIPGHPSGLPAPGIKPWGEYGSQGPPWAKRREEERGEREGRGGLGAVFSAPAAREETK